MLLPKIRKKVFLFLLIYLFAPMSLADEGKGPQIGNFAVPGSQQPGPLIGFGEHVIDAKQTQVYLFLDNLSGRTQHFADIIPGVLYGITDKLSIFFNIPFASTYQQDGKQSSGLEDLLLQFEYAYYKKEAKNDADFSVQATVLASISFPTGSIEKQPPTGEGSPSYLIGTTYNITYAKWWGFMSPGAILTTSKNLTKFGNKYLYQAGFGRNLYYKPSSWILTAMLEVDGQYSEKDKIQGAINPDSGGNVILLTPSLWFSTNKLILQLGIGFPVVQQLSGCQNKNHTLLAANIGWTF